MTPRPVTFIVGIQMFTSFFVFFLSAWIYDADMAVNDNIDRGVKTFQTRIELFAIPTSSDYKVIYDTISPKQWRSIRAELISIRLLLRDFEYRVYEFTITAAVCFCFAFSLTISYCPPLWSKSLKHGYEDMKMYYHIFTAFFQVAGTMVKLLDYATLKMNYLELSEITRQIIVRITKIDFPEATHFCYSDYSREPRYTKLNADWHELTPSTHYKYDWISEGNNICHPDVLHISVLIICFASILTQCFLFLVTSGKGYSYRRWFGEVEELEQLTMHNYVEAFEEIRGEKRYRQPRRKTWGYIVES